MLNIETPVQQATTFRLGLLGAGRLGEAIAKVWLRRTGEAPVVWSRSGPSRNGEVRIAGGTWTIDWTEALNAQSLIVAMPGRAFLDLAEKSVPARTFAGTIFSAAASLSLESLRRVFPLATIVCIAPFLIDETNSIPMLALRPPGLPDWQWEKVKLELESFGDVDVVHDEDLFAQLSLLGASWPTVVLAAIQAAGSAGVEGLPDAAAVGLGQRLFFRAMQSLLATDSLESSGSEVATPGGITEQGLNKVGELTVQLKCAFAAMQRRAGELRV